jgi:hypothetical protein
MPYPLAFFLRRATGRSRFGQGEGRAAKGDGVAELAHHFAVVQAPVIRHYGLAAQLDDNLSGKSIHSELPKQGSQIKLTEMRKKMLFPVCIVAEMDMPDSVPAGPIRLQRIYAVSGPMGRIEGQVVMDPRPITRRVPPDKPLRRDEIDQTGKIFYADLDGGLILESTQTSVVDPFFYLFSVS